ncbi:unnamed protein product [Rhizoctonia solani]|uniref:Uncharacterized protein n=1 Tax=Rhizoctonia solani TaxID=456999 RepID=A0A8H3D8D3_9AGAM|nr:unnamed protein product [Rhizoctonia solani]
MVVQSAMNAAISALRNAVGNDKKHKATLNKIRDAFKQVEADDLPRSEMVERGTHLAEIISESVTSLHKTRPRPTLAFWAAAVSWLFKAKLEPTLEGGDEEDAKVWEDTIFRGLMQPILSIVDSGVQDLDVAGNVIYRAICGIMRSPWSHGFGGRFAHSLALVLLSTCSSSGNKAMLLDPSILGTDALSKLIIDAKDYHHLDTLLELSFTMFSSQGGKVTRKAYADSIFNSGYALEKLPDDISNELASIHSVTNGGNSEKHVLDIMRTMSRAGIERQVFMTKDLSYCGTRFAQAPPSNVIILDHKNLCIVFCDKNGESDVLSVAIATIKSVELIPQDASRIIVELVVAEPPLISSSREELEIPDSHIPGSPPKIRLSIASSDILGLEVALAARDLVGVLKDDNALTRHSSLASTKISNAISSVPLKKNRNPSNDQTEEMIRKYVNLPSSSPPPSEHVKPNTRAAQPRPPPPRAPVAPAPATRPATPLQTEKFRSDSPSVPRSTTRSTPQASLMALDDSAPTKPAGSTTTRTKRTAAEKSKRAIKLAALADIDGSELTDIDPESTPEHPGPQIAVKTPADAPALPTPPRTRARVQQTKPAAKTLVPSTPTMEDLSDVSSPPNAPSPSPKPVRKRKLVGDDPFELPPLKPERPTKQRKTADTSAFSSSQHIRPRDTAATRAKAKYGTTSKRMRASSPVESIHSADTGADSPQKKAPTKTERKKRDDAPAKDTSAARMRPRLNKNDEPDVPKRQTRARAANAKPKPAASVDTMNTKQKNDSEENATIAPGAKAMETSNPPKKKVGRPPKAKPTQQLVKLLELPSEAIYPNKQATPQLESQTHGTPNGPPSTGTDGKNKAEPAPAPTTEAEEVPEDDDLLERLSQAAKKALKSPMLDNQPIISPRRSSSPVKPLDIEMEDPDVDVDTVEPPTQDLETRTPKEVAHQVLNATFEPVESVSAQPSTKPLSARLEKGLKVTSANTKASTKRPDVPKDDASNPKTCVGVTQTSTELHILKDITTNIACAGASMDTFDTKKLAPIPPRPADNVAHKVPRQQDRKPTPTFVHIEARTSTPQEHKSAVLPETPVQHQPERTKERIQPENPAMTPQSPVHQVETPPAKDARRTKFPPTPIYVDSDDEMEPSQEFASYQENMEPIRRPGVLTSRSALTTQPIAKPQSQPLPAPAKAKHAAVTRVLFDIGTQPSPKSALASPQRRTLANGARPSVSFLEPPVHLPRRGSSGSSTEGAQKQRMYGVDRARLGEGHSARTGDVMLQIVDILTEIQETVALNLGEKIQTVNAEARSARMELTKSVIEELDKMKVECESHHNVLHEFESAFAAQAQAMLDGLGRVGECNSHMNVGIGNTLAANARAGRSIAGGTLDFQVPKLFSAFLTS